MKTRLEGKNKLKVYMWKPVNHEGFKRDSQIWLRLPMSLSYFELHSIEIEKRHKSLKIPKG